ncbi:Fic family protein [Gulosibacter chungangensis]|uniref:Fic family protein n=1 Tax=Gulosibacter chungangensis TaxID=979746 RepID=A0A7J5BBP3_9MICO|nr:Fic family protein [Gulosibacter chungangensis]KAB1642146.1 Fic family protein [Gulosibacter chungangensis]
MWNANEPFNDLPAAPIEELETRAVLKATVGARAELAGLNEALKRMPNPAVLLQSISLIEAQASSEIENIVTTIDELFRSAAHVEQEITPATKETLRYRTALYAGLESIKSRPITSTTASTVCTQVTGRDMSVRNLSGTFIGNPTTGLARYTPPDGAKVIREKLAEWETLVHDASDVDPLVIMAAAHYQFEAIHPFADGNGRTGRILNSLMLVERELLSYPVLYLSKYIIRNKNEYYDRLLEVTSSEAWEPWILFMLDGVTETSRETLLTVEQVDAARRSVRTVLREVGGSNSYLLDLLFELPYVRINNVVARCDVSRPTATKWLNELVEAGVLIDERIGRERLFINVQFLRALTLSS